jgi:RimJ/RimL family protein N-acetyltransferase
VPKTARLLLRRPSLADAAPFAAVNADPEVARYVSATGPLGRSESDVVLRSMIDQWDAEGFGLWMAELLTTGEVVGFIGLSHPSLPALAEEVEVGWRLGRAHWGAGLATEGGAEAVRLAFDDRGLERLVCIVDRDNALSLRVAHKLGFAHWRDMEHPRWPRGVQVHTLERAAS